MRILSIAIIALCASAAVAEETVAEETLAAPEPAAQEPAAQEPAAQEPAAPEPAAPEPAAPEPTPAAPFAPEPAPRTYWQPFDDEVTRTADGSMRVCSTIALPLTIIPGVGEVIGTISDWFCIIPAAVAVDYAGAHHGHRETHLWQPGIALVLKKAWETLADTPIMVITIGAIIAIAAGGVALAVFGGLPVSVVTGLATGITLAVYLGLRVVRDAVGNFLFKKTYGLLVDEVSDESLETARESAWLQPGMSGVPASFGLMATVAGSKPSFDWAHAVPVVGPVWRSEAHASLIKSRIRRFGKEVLHQEKGDLSTMDTTTETIAAVQGYAMAAAHVGIGTGVALVGVAAAVALNDQNDEHQFAAEGVGIAGLVGVIGGAACLVVATGAERLQAFVVPAVWANAE